MDANLLHISYEGDILEDPWAEPEDDMWRWTVSPEDAFLLLEYCKIRECYAVANAFTIRNMYCLLLYMKCSSRKINRPTKSLTKIVTLLHF
jgi:argininosuccinate synthase